MNFETLAIIALGILVFGLVSKRLQMSIVTPPMAFTVLGLLLGSLGLMQFGLESPLVDTLAELTLVLVLFTDATRINLSLLRQGYGLALRLLGIGLPLTIMAGTGVGALLFESLSFWEVAVLAAILAPTDAALGQAVVSDERVPVRIRQTLNVESGLNDGLALPVVLLFISLVGMETEGVAAWLGFVSLQLLLAPIVGVFVGFVGGALVDRASRSGWMNTTFTQLSALALALLTFALTELVGGNGFIAAFVAGLTLGNTKREVCHQLYEFAETEGQLLTLFVFLTFGAIMVGPALMAPSWQAVLYAVLSLTVIRMLPVAFSLLGAKLQTDTILFLGWFGPRGIASLIYGLLVLEHALPQAEALFNIIILTVLLSTFLHGLTAVPFAKLYGDKADAMKDEPDMPEMETVTEMPLRF